jgi:hypothetical protein
MAVAPQNIMAQLRGMPDAQLAQYASMHKNDPFIFPLAFQESQSRKQTRASHQAQMAGQEQPKVVDQMVSQMMPQQASQLPEDIGIGQLPAKNLQRMAGGGIVAFEEGGEVPRFNGQFGSGVQEEVPMSTFQRFKGLFSPFSAEDVRTMQAQDFANRTDPGFFEKLTPTQRAAREQEAADARAGKGSTYTPGSADTLKKIQETALTDPKDYARITAAGVKNTPSTEDKAKINPDNAGKTGDKKEGAGKSGAAAGAVNKPVAGLDALSAAYKPSSAADLGTSAKALALEANKESEAAYKPYAEMLQKERADLEGRKSENKNMALLRAGLGIMGGKSRHAFQNISQGGVEGLNAYQEAKRLDDASKKALMGSEIAMMQAQRAERSGNHKDAVALIGQAEQNQQFGVNAGLKAQELKQTGEYQKGMVDVQRGRNTILGANNAQANKQMAEYGKIQTKVMGMLKDDMAFQSLKTDAEREAYKTKLLRAEMMNNPFLSALSANIGFAQAPTSGQMRGDYTEQ